MAVVAACTASTSPACTPVMACGALMDWKIDRASRAGVTDRLLVTAR